ncbi:MAG: hypothetical protein IJ038_00765 [Clostridia bacterium]|nr:hypothetical protein [Clostridia bacterium]
MKKDKSEKEIAGGDGSYVVKKNKKLNLFAFILCFVASFFIWIYVMNTQNSNYTKTFSIAIEVINESELLSEQGLSVFGLPERTASVTIQGKKSDVQKYSEKDFRAYIDVSVITEKGSVPVSIAIETPTTAVSVIAIEPKTFTVYADYLDTKTVAIEPFSPDSATALFSSDTSSLTITGPRAYLEKISSAKVAVPYYDSYSAGTLIPSSDIRLYDDKDKQLSSLYMTFDKDSITVKVEETDE